MGDDGWYYIGIISIHAPRVGGDVAFGLQCGVFNHFNPRPPCGGRLELEKEIEIEIEISIHAPRVGGDGKNS